MNVILTCEYCNFSQVRPNNKLNDNSYKSKYYPINFWICNKCGKDNFNGIKSVNK